MILHVTNDLKFLTLEKFEQEELDQLYVSLRRRIRNYRFHPLCKRGMWDGYIDFIDKGLRIPIGLWNIVNDVCVEYGFDIEIVGMEKIFELELKEEDFRTWVDDYFVDSDKKPRNYQIDAAWNIIKWKRSISELATNAGKTLIIYMVFAYLKQRGRLNRMLIVVPTANLILQTIEEFTEHSRDGEKFQFTTQPIASGTNKSKKDVDVIIGTYQSLKNLESEFFNGIDTVCIDEAHQTNTKSIKTILSHCRDANVRFGLSGTMQASDKSAEAYTIQSLLGPMVNKVSVNFLIKNKYATPVYVRMIYLDYLDHDIRKKLKMLNSRKKDFDPKKLYGIERQLVVNDEHRFKFICDYISKVTKNTLVLFSNVKDEYGKRIYEKLRDIAPEKEVFYVDGGTGEDNRDYYKKTLEEGHNKILIASFGTFSTGISINNIHNIVFVEAWKSERIIKQSIGRGMRLKEGKEIINIIDFVDDYSLPKYKNYMVRHSEERLKIYKREKFIIKKAKLKFY